MREQLIQYVNLLFAGAPDSEDIRAEILQNTLDRYDDLIAQGKSPEAAYRLAISGIGDINEILGAAPQPSPASHQQAYEEIIHEEAEDARSKKMRAVAIAMYILCPVPLFILSEFGLATLGLCLTLGMVAAATYVMMLIKKNQPQSENTGNAATYQPSPEYTAQRELKKSVSNLIWAGGVALYFIVSFATNAWYITWIIFPLLGSIQGLVNAIIDLKEANKHED